MGLFGLGTKRRAQRGPYKKRGPADQRERLRLRFLRELQRNDPGLYRELMLADVMGAKGGTTDPFERFLDQYAKFAKLFGGGATESPDPLANLKEAAQVAKALREIGAELNPSEQGSLLRDLAEALKAGAPAVAQLLAMAQARAGGQVIVGGAPQAPPAEPSPPALAAPEPAAPPGPREQFPELGGSGMAPPPPPPPPAEPLPFDLGRWADLVELEPEAAADRAYERATAAYREGDDGPIKLLSTILMLGWTAVSFALQPYAAHPQAGPTVRRLLERPEWAERFLARLRAIQEAADAQDDEEEGD